MRPTTIACVLAMATGASAQTPGPSNGGPVTWARVTDAHHSSLEVPISRLKRLPDQLGLTFEADQGQAKVTFFTTTETRPGFPGHDPKGDLDLKQSDCSTWPPAYYALKENLAAYSCVKAKRVTYYVARYNGSGSMTLYAEYPLAEKSFWDGAVGRMAGSMRQEQRTPLP